MTLYEYNQLDELEQHETLWDNGVMIGGRKDDEHNVVLYQVFSFYVELYYHREYNVIRRLRSFSDTECLDAYIKDFTLPEIKNNYK